MALIVHSDTFSIEINGPCIYVDANCVVSPSLIFLVVHMGDFWGRFLVLSRETPCGEAIYGPSSPTTASEAAAVVEIMKPQKR